MLVTDQTGRTIKLDQIPKRIVSVVPSQSELLWDFGLRTELIGITKFCIHPDEMFRNIARVGGTKKLDIEKIKLLKPDIIIANKEENEKGQIEELCDLFPVWISDIKTQEDAYQMIAQLGNLLGKEKISGQIVSLIKKGFEKLPHTEKKRKAAYFIWKDPLMLAGQDTFINAMLNLSGFENILTDITTRYPEISAKELQQLHPEYILLSSEPYPFNEKHIKEFKEILPDAKVLIVDGELFSWYGSRLIYSPAYFEALIEK